VFLKDTASGFEPELFIHDNKEEIEACKKVLLRNFKHIQVIYLEGVAKSKHYPEIDADVFIDFIQRQND